MANGIKMEFKICYLCLSLMLFYAYLSAILKAIFVLRVSIFFNTTIITMWSSLYTIPIEIKVFKLSKIEVKASGLPSNRMKEDVPSFRALHRRVRDGGRHWMPSRWVVQRVRTNYPIGHGTWCLWRVSSCPCVERRSPRRRRCCARSEFARMARRTSTSSSGSLRRESQGPSYFHLDHNQLYNWAADGYGYAVTFWKKSKFAKYC